jgi:hypothetical protein
MSYPSGNLIRRIFQRRLLTLTVAFAATSLLAASAVFASSPRLNQTFRHTVHNAFWFGGASEPVSVTGPKQHILDGLYIDRARGIELDLHWTATGGREHWDVYHTNNAGFTMCVGLDGCLEILRAWHFANPLHDVFFLHLEAKNTEARDPFFTEAVTPFTLDNLLSLSLGDRIVPENSFVFGPKDYYLWCERVRLPELFPNSATRPGLDRNNLKDAVRKCGWPTMEELRGRVIVTLHGNYIHNEDFVHFYSHGAGTIADYKIFPMASVIGDPFNGGTNWDDHSVFADVLRIPFPWVVEPYDDPVAGITEFVRDGGIVRSSEKNDLPAMARAIDNILNLRDLPGYNILTTDVARMFPVNVQKDLLENPSPAGPVDWATGCLFKEPGSSEFQDGCTPDALREPGSGISILSLGEGTIDLFTDSIVFLHTTRRPGVGNLRAFVSTRTDQADNGDLNGWEGNLGCLMARSDPTANAAFFAVCRRGHRASWDSSELGIWVYFRLAAGERLQAFYQPDTDSEEDISGRPQVQSYLRLQHSADGRCFQGFMKSTFDPRPAGGFSEVELTGGPLCFAQPLSLIGISSNGGRDGRFAVVGEHFFANVRYNNNFLTLAQLSDPRQGGGKMDTTRFPESTVIADHSFDLPRFAAVFNSPPVALCKDVTVIAGPACTAAANIDNGSYDPNPGDTLSLAQNPAGPYAKGSRTVTLTVTDSSGAANAASTCAAQVTVVDRTPPTITRLSASPNVLGPPNHKMIPIAIDAAATDNCDGAPACRISAVRSDEPQGAHEPDWQISGPLTVDLRAERDGSGDGRIYTLEITCTDVDGNSATRSTTVSVPHH